MLNRESETSQYTDSCVSHLQLIHSLLCILNRINRGMNMKAVTESCPDVQGKRARGPEDKFPDRKGSLSGSTASLARKKPRVH